jgi:uncharacterized protein YbbC (DUF1343 family)
MPTLDTALVYAGSCLFEATNLSEGRGTTRPFELLGAPWIDPHRWIDAVEEAQLDGVTLRPIAFRPTFDKFMGVTCRGVQIHVTDRWRFRPLRTGVALLAAAAKLWPREFEWRKEPYEFVADRPAIDLLAGGAWLREGVEQRQSVAELTGLWDSDEQVFRQRRAPHLKYG